jgi:tetratricopeptide (TPR) repeat protein
VPGPEVISVRGAAGAAALVAALCYLPALGNGFTLDDWAIVERNPTAHSIRAAISAFDQPYWPPEHGAGLYRPLVVLSFAVDWQLSGGSARWFHAVNLVWHAAATALLVPVVAAYAGPAAALAGGIVFAVHPVHVEAVANVVGRAELMTAAFLFGALLLARAVRRRRRLGASTIVPEIALFGATALALLSKEHAVVAVALLALDDLGTGATIGPHLPWRDYAGVLLLTAVWFAGRRAVEGGLSFEAVAPTFFLLGPGGRLSTMLPVVFVLLRLLVAPFDLSPDYQPQVLPRLEHLTVLGVAGAVVLAACGTLALALWKKQRAASVGLLFIGITWLPTANLLFPSGVVIAERTLYLVSAGVALLAALGAGAIARRWGSRRAVLATVVVALAFGAKSATATGLWRSNQDLIFSELESHPESYRLHQTAARILARRGLRQKALAEYGVAVELYPFEYANLLEAAEAAADAGNWRRAEPWLRQALVALRAQERVSPLYPPTERLLARALIRLDSAAAALGHARRAAEGAPRDQETARVLVAAFLALHQPDSARAVWARFLQRGGSPFWGWLLRSSTFATIGMMDSARVAYDSASARASRDYTADAVAVLFASELRELRDFIQRSGAHPPVR